MPAALRKVVSRATMRLSSGSEEHLSTGNELAALLFATQAAGKGGPAAIEARRIMDRKYQLGAESSEDAYREMLTGR
jgi:hypothetical protein